MTAIKGLLGWVRRKAIIFILLVLALVAHQLLLPTWRSHSDLGSAVKRLRQGDGSLANTLHTLIDRANARTTEAQRLSAVMLDRQITETEAARQQAAKRCNSDLAATFTGGAQAVIENRRACLTEQIEERQVVVLRDLRGTIDARRPGESLAQALRRHTAIMRQAVALNRAARAEIARRSGNMIDRYRYSDPIRQLATTANRSAARYKAAKGQAERLISAQRRVAEANTYLGEAIAQVRSEYQTFLSEREGEWGGSFIERTRGFANRVDLKGKLRRATILLGVIIATPLLIRLFCYFVLAPLAVRRPSIRLLVPDGAEVPISPAAPSATSVAIRLTPGEELLVRQDFLQTSSYAGSKRTQCFLDWRKPFTSIATGLTFLTRIRGDGEVTTVSAVRDGLAEVTILNLDDGASCVLQPRALAAVAQPVRSPLRITRHWRLGSLNAWPTLQLRYLVFHGPARLVLKGGRGVRVEAADQGRVFGQEQLVGFSADLAYSVTRTETLWPYLIGRQPLLKDHVMAGKGVLIVEEAPYSARRGEVRNGVEGIIDAGMKVFGM